MPMAYSEDFDDMKVKEESQSSCGPIVAARCAMEMDMPEAPLTQGERRAAEEFGGVYRRASSVGEIRDAYSRGIRAVQKIMEVHRLSDPAKRAKELAPLLGYLAVGKDIVLHRAGASAPPGVRELREVAARSAECTALRTDTRHHSSRRRAFHPQRQLPMITP